VSGGKEYAMQIEFTPFPKISRLKREVIMTEEVSVG
jgi:hypothetical protein